MEKDNICNQSGRPALIGGLCIKNIYMYVLEEGVYIGSPMVWGWI